MQQLESQLKAQSAAHQLASAAHQETVSALQATVNQLRQQQHRLEQERDAALEYRKQCLQLQGQVKRMETQAANPQHGTADRSPAEPLAHGAGLVDLTGEVEQRGLTEDSSGLQDENMSLQSQVCLTVAKRSAFGADNHCMSSVHLIATDRPVQVAVHDCWLSCWLQTVNSSRQTLKTWLLKDALVCRLST